MQFLALASIVAIIGVAGIGAASTLRDGKGDAEKPGDRPAAGDTASNGARTPAPAAAGSVVQQSTPASTEKAVPTVVEAPSSHPTATETAPTPVSTPTPAPAPTTASTPVRANARGGYVLVEGRTQLNDSVYAIRSGDSVIVNFDAYGYRTRRSDKLESSLRLTLPMVFGKMATASMDTLAEGELVTSHDVVGALAHDGMRLTLDNGAVARLRVLTRVVTDGPIAIGYLAVIER